MKQISLHDFFLREKDVLQKIQDSLSLSFGPKSKAVIFSPHAKNLSFLSSGSEILKSLQFKTYEENILLKFFQLLSKQSNIICGDGSTSIALFFAYLLSSSFILLLNGHNSIILSKGFDKISVFLSDFIFQQSISPKTKIDLHFLFESFLAKKIEKKEFSFFRNLFEEINKETLIQIEENDSQNYAIQKIKGVEIDKGFISSYFINNLEYFQTSYKNSFLLICSSPLKKVEQIQTILSFVQQKNFPLVIIVESISKELLSLLILNYIKKHIKVVIIKYSSLKTLKNGLLEDLAFLSHSTYYEPTFKNGNLIEYTYTVKDLGLIHKVIIKKNSSVFYFSKYSNLLINRRINELNRELLLSENNYEKSLVSTRIARLNGNIIKLSFPNKDNIIFSQRKKTIEEVLKNIQGSLQEGYLVGGGSIYCCLIKQLSYWSNINLLGDEVYASHILIKALQKLFLTLFNQSKISNFLIFQKLFFLNYPYSYDLRSDSFVNGKVLGIYDSSKTIRVLFTNSLSLLSSLITSNCD